ncbi:hypothetical protein BLNAU_9512 [Blattamonas nauphoetae]|uniref:Saposin B-type domain-containing protein n=1 Tax=Blattamonas nauphoetae TaxID=2049346 RepID=A0ABQ9XVH0_9EUKA|nr:hypothetical protein BLNAU_9512 [Blattamonas nauphoetae]
MLSLLFCLFSATQAYWEDDYFYEEIEYDIYEDEDLFADTFGKCDICKMLVKSAEEAGITQKEPLKTYLQEKICSKLGFLTGMCNEMVGNIVNQTFQMILDEIAPEIVCKKDPSLLIIRF